MRRPLAGSGIRAVFDRARELERAGRSVIHMEIGRPHLDPPREAVEGAVRALQTGRVHYSENRGIAELRQAIAERLAAAGMTYDSDREVVVTAGGSEAVAAAMLALLENGDEIVVPVPAWPHYAAHAALAGARAVEVPCTRESGFALDPDAIAGAITPRTRAVVVSSPSNPTGAVFGATALDSVAELCLKHDLCAISDEIYDRFVYGDACHSSIATREGMKERTVVAQSFSKSHSMTGWRVGFAAATGALGDQLAAIHQYLTVCAPTFAQHGVVAALQAGDAFTAGMVAQYRERRDALVAGVREIAGLELEPPMGAFYAFPRVTLPGVDGGGLASWLIEEAGVATVPGAVFGTAFSDHLRLSYALDETDLQEGLGRIRGLLT
jgi:aspartate aminotransferase/aminotransferase